MSPSRSYAPRPGVTPAPKYPVGTVVQSKNPTTSKLEEQVRGKLVAAGLQVHQGRSAIQCDQDPIHGNYPVLTPDVLVSRSKVCVEIDSEKTHTEEVDNDRSRNALLAGVGWTVVRLRLGGLEAIGDYDVVCEASVPSAAAIDALVAAVTDAVDGVPGTVRRIAKKTAAPRKKEKSRLGAVAAHSHHDGAYYASWTLEDGEKLRLIIMDEGRWLAAESGHGAPRFIRLLELHRVDRKKWREELEGLFTTTDTEELVPVSKYPWGEEFFIGPQADKVHLYDKFHPGMERWALTANLDGPAGWGPGGISGSEGVTLADLHPEAIACGWRLTAVAWDSGYRGDFQRLEITRTPERTGHWA
ncbi:hypothetical protein GCM10011374_35680 [Kocuria dechangensis]|uniref:DUF559 domain-containing protein n=1 Tax=Kocuria dechangensis TaxID=1176249 RepID=A0A917H5I5_9MICC|nr:DUF559 domain-containing protein [Kocuria dechangensis]GGG68208.1 hypothetical protein GCM10011374_35680 [Kocuria dechangensis]